MKLKYWKIKRKGWKTKIPKIRQAISNIEFYVNLQVFDMKHVEKLNLLIKELWDALISEVKNI